MSQPVTRSGSACAMRATIRAWVSRRSSGQYPGHQARPIPSPAGSGVREAAARSASPLSRTARQRAARAVAPPAPASHHETTSGYAPGYSAAHVSGRAAEVPSAADSVQDDRSCSRARSSSGLPAPARTQSATRPGSASGKAARTRVAAAPALSGARVWVCTRAGDSPWASPWPAGSMSYWLRSVTTSSTGSPSTSRAASVSQRRDAGSAACASSTATNSGPHRAYVSSSRH
ncbi:hypothetical protein GA0115245_11761, partial [Streptomyces sp. di188]